MKLNTLIKGLIIKSIAILMIIGTMDSAAFSQTRVNFARGKSSTTVSGTLSANGKREYVLGARKGQRMTLRLTSNTGDAYVDVDGTDYGSGATITLPANDNNIRITVHTDQRRSSRFSLSITIR